MFEHIWSFLYAGQTSNIGWLNRPTRLQSLSCQCGLQELTRMTKAEDCAGAFTLVWHLPPRQALYAPLSYWTLLFCTNLCKFAHSVSGFRLGTARLNILLVWICGLGGVEKNMRVYTGLPAHYHVLYDKDPTRDRNKHKSVKNLAATCTAYKDNIGWQQNKLDPNKHPPLQSHTIAYHRCSIAG